MASAADLRARARAHLLAAADALEAGDEERARKETALARAALDASDVAAALEAGPSLRKKYDKAMTTGSLQRRGRAVARSRASNSSDPRRAAIVAAYGSLAAAARDLHISPQVLADYLAGRAPCPARVASAVERAAGLPAAMATWPRGVVP